MRVDLSAVDDKNDVARSLITKQRGEVVERRIVDRYTLRSLNLAERKERPLGLAYMPSAIHGAQHKALPSARVAQRANPRLSEALVRRNRRVKQRHLFDELDRVEPSGTHVAVAERARADKGGSFPSERDLSLLQLPVDVEGDRLAHPIEAEFDEIPLVRHVRRCAVRGAAGAEEAHLAVLGELELRHALVHLVRLAQDEVARIRALVVGARVEADRVGSEVAVEDAQILRAHVFVVLELPRGARGWQLERHAKVGIIATLQEQ
mmetsp:Transcript_53473/g.122887  ORF Transcript_53473/g.122887 Transcript_53473/m.122887 type:complete len:264 (-) Transcript_53473:294-1085(-)